MIQKVIRIENVGRLEVCQPRGDVEFTRLTLLFARNGRGKTTLSDILRSVQSGTPDYIEGRRTLGVPGAPVVHLKTNGGVLKFENGAWSAVEPSIVIFGAEFIEQNVYTGSTVTHDHKKGLYRVIIGEVGVRLARAVEELDERLRVSTRAVTEARSAVARLALDGVSVEAFLGIQPEEDLAAKREAVLREIANLEKATAIASTPALGTLALPDAPDSFAEVLARSLDGVAADAEERVRRHLGEHTQGASEAWIAQGLRSTKDQSCPYCGQSLDGLDLVHAYQGYFKDEYRSLVDAIRALDDEIGAATGDGAIQRLLRLLEQNRRLTDFWTTVAPLEIPVIDEAVVQEGIDALRQHLQGPIRAKRDDPLTPLRVEEGFVRGAEAYETLAAIVERYNSAIEAANVKIAAKKRETERGDLDGRRAQLARLNLIERRFVEEGAAAAAAYGDALAAKAALDREKQRAKRTLDEYTEALLPAWETDLNRLLRNFGAGFRIGQVGRQYLGGTASSTYQIVIKDVPVPLGDRDTPRGQPSFRNTLSAGDRAALAFTFFVAMLGRDPQLGEKIIVFDDPFSSLDTFRRSATQQAITRLARSAGQIIVLSHDERFLRLLADHGTGGETKVLKFSGGGGRTQIVECDLDAETQSTLNADIDRLQEFLERGSEDRIPVARAIRPVLESTLQRRFPGMFPAGQQVGDMIAAIRAAGPDDALASAQSDLPEIEDINEFARRYHHEGGGEGPIDPGELESYVRRVLDLHCSV